MFEKKNLKIQAFSANSVFGCHNSTSLKLVTRFRLGLSHRHKRNKSEKSLDVPNKNIYFNTLENSKSRITQFLLC